MPVLCNAWQTYGCEWNVVYLWRGMDLFRRLDFATLALMLTYIVTVVSLGCFRHWLARRQFRASVCAAATAFQNGAFEEGVAIAVSYGRGSILMSASAITAFLPGSAQLTLAEATDVASRAFQRSRRSLVADLNVGINTLKSIATAAPLLGLAGTCVGILSAFSGIGMERNTALAMILSKLAAATITTAAGILVAVPAVVFYNYLRTRMDMFEREISDMTLEAKAHLKAHPQRDSRREHFVAGSKGLISPADASPHSWENWHDSQRNNRSFRFAQALPLKKRFSELPAFALIGAPAMTILALAFVVLPSDTATGLPVRLVKTGVLQMRHFSVEPIIIALEATSAGDSPIVYVNSKKTPWNELDNRVRSELTIRPPQCLTYVEAESNVQWADVANVIDVVKGLHAEVVLLTIKPDVGSSRARRPARQRKLTGPVGN